MRHLARSSRTHLGRHGISAELMEVSSGGKHVPDVLLTYIADLQVDLLIMGAYGHPRLFEFMFGGTTQSLLDRITIPVLMSH
ncbi:universal stress protein [Beijerinckia indica]|uniref:UspA n=1 Tax=Beijerinckia indica subsp. indica (strain ATCC 9039 / DSM 1715 / NCIMB 8712) TaxID=395963 RepID=B2II27_BEII9|nr:universal stress protein [Beijerinckia indica]ACB94610.1 UspA [Beijerinckia indica subsp. indica ATCC 9039]